MESIKIWIISIFGAGIVVSVFNILIGNSKVKKTANIFLSMFVFFYTVIPIAHIAADYKLDIENTEIEYAEIYKNGYELLIRESVVNICKENNALLVHFSMDSYIDSEGYLNVNYIEIQLNDSDKNEIIKNEIKNRLQIEVTLI